VICHVVSKGTTADVGRACSTLPVKPPTLLPAMPPGWGPIRSLLSLSPLLLFVPWFSVHQYYHDGNPLQLPLPISCLFPFPPTLALPVPVTEL
jgi:hypothetical protein